MSYRKWVVPFLIVLFSFPGSTAIADTVIYRSKNKIDYVKIEKASKKEKEGGLRHPDDLDPEQIRSVLRSIHFNKKALLSKNISDQFLFDERNVEFLAPYLIEAFKKAGPEEVVVVSFFTRKSHVVIQDDRLTIFRSFVKEDGLHLVFTKLYAKMLGDRTTMGASRVSQEARSLRVGLEVQPGQNRISWDPEELVFDLSYFAPGGVKTAEAPKKEKGKKETVAADQPAVTKEKSVKERLKELDQLKKDELITEKEYQKKRKELIEEL